MDGVNKELNRKPMAFVTGMKSYISKAHIQETFPWNFNAHKKAWYFKY